MKEEKEMEKKEMSEKLCLRLTRVIRAPRGKCFEVWTKPELMARWLAPSPMTVSEATADVRVGGEYRIAMSGTSESGKCVNASVTGVYKEIVPNDRITFTWRWPDDPHPETTVSVEFRDVEHGTELTLTHRGFESEDVLAQHEHGWQGCLDKMERSLADAGDYARTMTIAAPCGTVFDALATVDGPKGWWTTRVSGSAETGGSLRFVYPGVEGHALMHVDQAVRPNSVQWACVENTILPDWVDTVIVFDLTECSPDRCVLNFRHRGLTPALECFDLCQAGWNRFLPSLKAYAETGQGTPIGGH